MLTLKKGILLIARPEMNDPFFFKTVILITHYDKNESIGFILNQHTDLRLNDVIKEEKIPPLPINIGGPVENNSIHYIHNIGNKITGATHITENLYWGGNFEEVKKLMKKGEISDKDIRFFCGYSGWSNRQLNDELRNESWVISELDIKNYNKYYNKNGIWRNQIQEIKEYAIWSNMPRDPNLN